MRYIRLYPRKIRLNFGILAVVLFYCYDVLYMLCRRVVGNDIFSQILCLSLVYGVLALAVAKKPHRLKADAIVLIMLAVLLFGLTYLFAPKYRYALLELPTWNALTSVFSFSKGIAAYLFFRMIKDKREMRITMRWCAYILSFWCILRIIGSLASGGFSRAIDGGLLSKTSYDMQLGYRLLLVSIIFGLEMLEARKGKRLVYGGIMLAASVGLLIYGSRTAVASLVIFWVMRALFCTEKKKKIGIIVLLLFVAVASMFILTNASILQSLGELLEKLGMKSRMLDTLIQGEIVLDKGRNRMWSRSLEMIGGSPVWGSGVFADRAEFGIYCHQIILEILLNFGCILGLLLIGLIAYLCMRSVMHVDREWRTIFVVFFSLWIVRLMMSSSYWVNTDFWVSMAIAISMPRRRRRKMVELIGKHAV